MSDPTTPETADDTEGNKYFAFGHEDQGTPDDTEGNSRNIAYDVAGQSDDDTQGNHRVLPGG